MPIDVALCQLGETNMAASRSAWQQYYRQCQRWQDEHIEQVSNPLNESLLREAAARGELPGVDVSKVSRLMRGHYVRPARAMPDPLKEAQAVQAWAAMKRDLTGLWAESGVDFQESVLQRAEDEKFMEAQGIEQAADPNAPDAGDSEDPKDSNDNSDEKDAPTSGDAK
jgi:capsid protein